MKVMKLTVTTHIYWAGFDSAEAAVGNEQRR